MKPIRILIADNDINFAQNLTDFLGAQEDIKVITTLRDGQGVVDACKKELPDLIIVDLHLPVLDSVRAIKSILAQNERVKVLCISNIPSDRYAVEAVKAGACGYIEKNGSAAYEEIAQAVRQAANGEVVLNPTLASSILREFYRFVG